MAGEMCTIYPSVKGKKSKLYMDMYNKTGHDRKLTNFLYAMSKLDDVRAKFGKGQFDRLGEIKSKDFMDWVHIEDLIADQNLLSPLEVIVKTPLSIIDVPTSLSVAHSFQLSELESNVSLRPCALTVAKYKRATTIKLNERFIIVCQIY